MTDVRVEDALARIQAAIGSEDRTKLWGELQNLSGRGQQALERVGELLGEPQVRRATALLAAGEFPLGPLALVLARLGRAREGTAALVLSQLRSWLGLQLKSPPPELLQALGLCGAPRSFEALLEAKVYGDGPTRAAAALGLGELAPSHPSHPEARLVLGDLLLHDPELSVRKVAAEALAQHFSDLDRPALLRLSLEGDPEIRPLLNKLWQKRVERSLPRPVGDRRLKYYVRQLHPGGKIAFFQEFEQTGQAPAAEGREDREPIEPYYSSRTRTQDGRTLMTLYDGTPMVEHPDGSITFSLGRADWRTRNSQSGIVTIRVPVDKPFEPRGSLRWNSDGVLRLRLDEGAIEEEYPDGRRILVSPVGVVQVISPRAEQGIQTDVQHELLKRQTAHAYVLIEDAAGNLELYGGELAPSAPVEGQARAIRLPYGALRLELRDGRVTRELVKGESSHDLLGGRTVSFVPRRGPHPILGLKTFTPGQDVVYAWHDGSSVARPVDGLPRYQLPDGRWIG